MSFKELANVAGVGWVFSTKGRFDVDSLTHVMSDGLQTKRIRRPMTYLT